MTHRKTQIQNLGQLNAETKGKKYILDVILTHIPKWSGSDEMGFWIGLKTCSKNIFFYPWFLDWVAPESGFWFFCPISSQSRPITFTFFSSLLKPTQGTSDNLTAGKNHRNDVDFSPIRFDIVSVHRFGAKFPTQTSLLSSLFWRHIDVPETKILTSSRPTQHRYEVA